MNKVWHYLPLGSVEEILPSGELEVSPSMFAYEEPPMLLFSANQAWEPSVAETYACSYGLSDRPIFPKLHEEFGGIRFGLDAVDSRLMNWCGATVEIGWSQEARAVLERIGRDLGADPDQWFAVAVPIPLADLKFQVWLQGTGWSSDLTISEAASWYTQQGGQ